MFRFCDGKATDAPSINLQNLNIQQPLDALLLITRTEIASPQLPILVAPLRVEVSGCFQCETEINACLKLEYLPVHRIISIFFYFGIGSFSRVYLIKQTIMREHVYEIANTPEHLGLLL